MRLFTRMLPILLLAVSSAAAAAGPAAWETPTIREDTAWKGEILLRQAVVVSEGAVLRVHPGTTVTVDGGKGIGITVLGRLIVEGKEDAPVTFTAGKAEDGTGDWEGIRLSGEGEGRHLLAGFRIERAREGISLTDTTAKISGGAFSDCGTGIRGNQKSSFSADNCVFDGNTAGAVVSLGGSGTFTGCRFENIGKYGIVADKGARFSVSSSTFSRGATGIFTLTNAPCRIEDSAFLSLETGILARQMGRDSVVARCRFENDGTGISAIQFCYLEISDSRFQGNRTGVDVREFSAPTIRHNRFEAHEAAVSLIRKSHARVERNVFFHNRNGVVVNYSSYPLIAGNNFDRNDMSIRLEKFQSGDWEEREGSPGLTAGEASLRGAGNRPEGIGRVLAGDLQVTFPKRVNAKGNFWGPDADRDRAKGTMGKIWDGRKFGPVVYEGFGEKRYEIDVVDFSGESPDPFPDAGPRGDGKSR